VSESVAVLTHIYYENSFEFLSEDLINLQKFDCKYYFNLCIDNNYNQKLVSTISGMFPGAAIIITPNKGKDIGGKLALIDLFLNMNDEAEYLLLLHDKMSPHTSMGNEWRKKLLAIIQDENIHRTLQEFGTDPKLGLIGSKDMLMNEYDAQRDEFSCTSSIILKQLKKEFLFSCSDHRFIGGTMFWIRAKLYRDFFGRYHPLSIRGKLETGNVMDHETGTITHAWERMLSWIILNQGYAMKGI
jgi:lipopolysaccharide biosynthesis protein